MNYFVLANISFVLAILFALLFIVHAWRAKKQQKQVVGYRESGAVKKQTTDVTQLLRVTNSLKREGEL